MQDEIATNAPELTVAELSNALKRTIEDRFGYVRVRGEISNYRGPHSSGHCYFSLKDEAARIDAVIWKGTFLRLKTKPQEGLEVLATGKVTTFPGKSAYQIIIEALEPAGVGALMALLEQRRRALAAEGLFDESRKRPLPFLPRSIGVVTSPTGAVIRDILHRIEERFPRPVLVWPVRVQGESSAAEVAAAIDGFNALPDDGAVRRPDVLIVARGGGSLEDLWSFNEEIVVRAAARSKIPLIAAVGHETDWTLVDFAADLRAPTPTAAAEKSVPVRAELAAQLADLGRRHVNAALRLIERRRGDYRALARALPQGEAIVALPRQRLDNVGSRLGGALSKTQDRRRIELARLTHRLAQQSPQARLARASEQLTALGRRLERSVATAKERRRQRLDHVTARFLMARQAYARMAREKTVSARRRFDAAATRLAYAMTYRLAAQRARVSVLGQLLGSLGYRQVLARGFALVRGEDGKPLRSAVSIADGMRLDLEFTDGHKQAIAGPSGGAREKPGVRRASRKAAQTSLFDTPLPDDG
jgi:exodeoxyribonuclease VII large subunit